eukprot:Rhum_TRINITY_DN5939_c0_g1::Rhum_TRINITY_DN5939_c0_g1_i1::g.18786::m.18786
MPGGSAAAANDPRRDLASVLASFDAVRLMPAPGSEAGGSGGPVHVVAVVRYARSAAEAAAAAAQSSSTSRPPHPYIPSLPAALQRHFNPRKMDMDRWEMPYHKSHNEWFDEKTRDATAAAGGGGQGQRPQQPHTQAEADAAAVCAALGGGSGTTAYAVSLTVAPHHTGNDGIHRLGRRLYAKLAGFVLALREADVVLSFVGLGVGGLLARASLPHFQRESSVLALSGVRVRLGALATVATPHLGARRGPTAGSAWTWVRRQWLVHSRGLLGKELLMEDADFALMELALHDGAAADALARFRRVAYVAVRGDPFASTATALSLADSAMTPLGAYVRRRAEERRSDGGGGDEGGEDDECAAAALPAYACCDPCTYRDGPVRLCSAVLRYVLLETALGLPAAAAAAFCAARWVVAASVAAQAVLAAAAFFLALAAGHAYHASFQPVPVEAFAHVGDVGRTQATFFKTARRVFEEAPTDAGCDLCVNLVKEVLNR